MSKRILRRISLLMMLTLLVSIGGVWANWHYTMDHVMPQSTNVEMGMHVFDYPPEEILPGGDQNEEDDQDDVNLNNTNHYTLIDLLLNAGKGYGLNNGNNSFLYRQLLDDSVVYSNQHVTGGNLKFILDDKNNTSGLYYCVEMISNTQCYAYTFSKSDLATAGGSVTEIKVYKTVLVKTDEWCATTSYLGYAPTCSLSSLGISPGGQADIYYTIDTTKWHA